MHRTAHKAHEDVQRVLREGEQVLSSCTSRQLNAGGIISMGPNEVDTTYIYTTNARLIWMSANNDGMVCVRWRYLTSVRLGRKRLKHTLAFSFQRPSWSDPID